MQDPISAETQEASGRPVTMSRRKLLSSAGILLGAAAVGAVAYAIRAVLL